MYNLFQVIVFIVFFVLAVLRLQFEQFYLLPFINSLTVVVSVFFIIYGAFEVLRKNEYKSEFQENREAQLFIAMLVVSAVGIGGLIYLCYHQIISSKFSDFLAIIAFGLSCAANFFSSLLYKNLD